MAEVRNFSADSVALGGCHPLEQDCGLTARDVEVRIGTEEYVIYSETWKIECRAKVGSIACETCGLQRIGTVRNIDVDFLADKTVTQTCDPLQPKMLIVMNSLPSQLAKVMFCQRETSKEDL